MEIKADTHEPIDITWPDGSTMRLRWDPSEMGVRVHITPSATARLDVDRKCASGLILRSS